MMRLIILLIGLVWASLLLISWGGNSEAQFQPPAPVAISSAVS